MPRPPHYPIPPITDIVLRRFVSKVAKSDGCWLWKGKTMSGYGTVIINQHLFRAHRVAWTIAYGPIPDELCVCHTCDNPRCVRPSHLWLGTQEENQEDKIRKGRQARDTRRRS